MTMTPPVKTKWFRDLRSLGGGGEGDDWGGGGDGGGVSRRGETPTKTTKARQDTPGMDARMHGPKDLDRQDTRARDGPEDLDHAPGGDEAGARQHHQARAAEGEEGEGRHVA